MAARCRRCGNPIISEEGLTSGLCAACDMAEDERETNPFAGLRPQTNGHRRTSWTARELMEATFDAPRFAVDGLIPEGLNFLAGAPKLGKSWLALGLSIAIASGGRVLGSVPVDQGPVLYLALEDSPRRLQSRLQTLLNGEHADLEALEVHTEWPRIDEGGVDRIDHWLGEHPHARLVLIDVWPRIRPRVGRRTDLFQADYEGAALVQRLAIERGVAIVTLYHTRKAEADDFVETVQGTLGTAAAADNIIVVKRSRGQADATLLVTGRDVAEQELALRFDASVGTWTILGDASEYLMSTSRREVTEAIRAHGSLTPKAMSELTPLTRDRAKLVMWRMARDGQLVAADGSYSLPAGEGEEPEEDDRGIAVSAISEGTHEGPAIKPPETSETVKPEACVRCQRYGSEHPGEHASSWT